MDNDVLTSGVLQEMPAPPVMLIPPPKLLGFRKRGLRPNWSLGLLRTGALSVAPFSQKVLTLPLPGGNISKLDIISVQSPIAGQYYLKLTMCIPSLTALHGYILSLLVAAISI